jgi:outer membrane protein assembly factor BamD (BamD/ComL family)
MSAEAAPPMLEGNAPPAASALPRAKADKALDSAASTGAVEPTIDEEIKLMNGAQAALHVGDPRRALQLLSEHARRFRNGKLASARAVTHMIALCALGRSSDARLEAERFLAKTPSSPFAERVRNVCSPRPSP